MVSYWATAQIAAVQSRCSSQWLSQGILKSVGGSLRRTLRGVCSCTASPKKHPDKPDRHSSVWLTWNKILYFHGKHQSEAFWHFKPIHFQTVWSKGQYFYFKMGDFDYSIVENKASVRTSGLSYGMKIFILTGVCSFYLTWLRLLSSVQTFSKWSYPYFSQPLATLCPGGKPIFKAF